MGGSVSGEAASQPAAVRALTRRNGLPLLGALLAIAAIIAGLLGSDLGAIVGLLAVLVTVALQIVTTERANISEKLRRASAMADLGDAARRYQKVIATGPSYGGTSMFANGEFAFDVARLAREIKAGRFDFLAGHRQDEWATLGASLRSGGKDFVARVGTIDGVPAEELIAARDLGDIGERAARRAYAVATAYAGFNVDVAQQAMRWSGPDQTVDLSMVTVYADLGDDVAQLAEGLARLAVLAPPEPGLSAA